MNHTIISYQNIHLHGRLFANFFEARHRRFIQELNWGVPEHDGMEFDQYDTPQSRWIAIHDEGS